jgi:hypothetical protein
MRTYNVACALGVTADALVNDISHQHYAPQALELGELAAERTDADAAAAAAAAAAEGQSVVGSVRSLMLRYH